MARVKKPTPLTLQATTGQLERWRAAARHTGRDLVEYVAFAADWTYRYLREQARGRKRGDPVGFRMEEKRRMDAVLRAAKEAGKFLPRAFECIYGVRLDPAGDLEKAIHHLEQFWTEHGEPHGV